MLDSIVGAEEIDNLSNNEKLIPDLLARIQSRVHEDDRDETLSELAKKLIDRSCFAQAETVVASISEDWCSVAAELLAEIAFGAWRQGKQARAFRLLARALRLSEREEWKWIEAESMLSVADAAYRMGQIDWFYSITRSAVEKAVEDMRLGDGLRSIDACGVMRSIALRLAAIGNRKEAFEVAQRIVSPTKRDHMLQELRNLATNSASED